MTICSLVVQTLPEQLEPVAQSLLEMEGVEIHARDAVGKLVVCLDHPSRDYCADAMNRMTRISGVMSTALVFEYQEDLEPDAASPSSPPLSSIATPTGDQP